MVGYAREADGAEEDRVMVAQLRNSVRGHHVPGRFVSLATPIEMAKTEAEAEFRAGRRENIETLGYDFLADTITGNDGYFVGLHRASAPGSSRIIGPARCVPLHEENALAGRLRIEQ